MRSVTFWVSCNAMAGSPSELAHRNLTELGGLQGLVPTGYQDALRTTATLVGAPNAIGGFAVAGTAAKGRASIRCPGECKAFWMGYGKTSVIFRRAMSDLHP